MDERLKIKKTEDSSLLTHTSSLIKVLLVEDNPGDARLLREMLAEAASAQFELTHLERLSQAIQHLGQEHFDLVLLDLSLVDGQGLDTVARTHAAAPDLPIVVLTGLDDETVALEAVRSGAQDYLIKGQINRHLLVRSMRYAIERKRVQQALRASEERYALAAHGANDGLWDWDLRARAIYLSPRWKSMLGYEEGELQNDLEEWFNRVHPEDVDRLQADIALHLKGFTPHFENQYRMLHKDGSYRWMLSRGLAIRDTNGKPARMAGSQTDVTNSRVYDALTGLPNRALFMDRLGCAVIRAKRRKDYMFAVLFLDLDRFKIVNDGLGHLVGDQLLVAIARRLEACLRPSDTVARLGGDEFAVLIDYINDVGDGTRVADRIQKQLLLPFKLNGQEVFASASIGIALSATGYDQPQDILRDADAAMYRAKALGRGRSEIFDKSMHERAMTLLQLEADLRRAVERQEFRLYYQPVVSLVDGHVVGAEALLRWQHAQRGLISPADFIPLAEETGLIVSLGEWVLRTACAQNKAWHEAGYAQLVISVNFSARQFQDQSLLEMIKKVLEETGLAAEALKLEITESVAMKNIDHSIKLLNELITMGIHTSMDDFGTGYSSLSYLKCFPISTLKIDRSFVKGIANDSVDAAMVAAIITLAHNLKRKVIAEGVETQEQLDFLRSHHCDEMQGYLFSQPLPADAFTKLLREGRCLAPEPLNKTKMHYRFL